MGLQQDQRSWYSSGLAFECFGCGKCCAGPEEGYVWVTTAEIAAISEHLQITIQQMRSKFVKKVGKRMSLVMNRKNEDCIFLKISPKKTGDGTDRGCSIYSVRPLQCRTWPFWNSNVETQDSWALAGKDCPGINRGPLHPPDEITKKAIATND